VILRWQPSDNTNLYASYSEGLIAGDFNTFFINADAREREQYLAADPRISEAVEAETLEAWEMGVKQAFFDGKFQVNLAYYKYTWENIKGRSSFQINETCRAGDIGTSQCDPANGIGIGDPKQVIDPATGELVPFTNSRNIILPGNAKIEGYELETSWMPSESFVMQYNMSYIDSRYTDYEFNFVAPIAGYAQMAGNQTPRQPKISYNLGLTKYFEAASRPAYVRVDYIYQGKSYVDESNLAHIAGYGLLNLRAGINTERYMIEFFVKNAMDEDAWMTGSRWTDFSSPAQFDLLTFKQGVAVSPLDRREFGMRVNYRF
jgi:iron complex outermembrane receptor protein